MIQDNVGQVFHTQIHINVFIVYVNYNLVSIVTHELDLVGLLNHLHYIQADMKENNKFEDIAIVRLTHSGKILNLFL